MGRVEGFEFTRIIFHSKTNKETNISVSGIGTQYGLPWLWFYRELNDPSGATLVHRTFAPKQLELWHTHTLDDARRSLALQPWEGSTVLARDTRHELARLKT